VDRGSFAIAVLPSQCDCAFPHSPRLLHVTGTREYQSLVVPHPVLDAVLSPGAFNFAVHSRLFSLKKGKVVTVRQHLRYIKFSFRGFPQDIRCFHELVKQEMMPGADIREGVVWIEPIGLFAGSNPPFILARSLCAPTSQNGNGQEI